MQFLPMAENPDRNEEPQPNTVVELLSEQRSESAEVCCGGVPPPKSSQFEQAGYLLQPHVLAFLKNDAQLVPLVKTSLEMRDHWGGVKSRIGVNRDQYLVAPGLYGVGVPDRQSPVIVTGNYKLTFDIVRRELKEIDCWLLVLDTCGINVWCAAGKKTFSTDELLHSIEKAGLQNVVEHRKLILPQFAATGVASHEVRLKSGFRVIYGPVRAADIKKFLDCGLQADSDMRMVTFTILERVAVIPVEITHFVKRMWWLVPLIFLLSAFDGGWFSLTRGVERGATLFAFLTAGVVMGTVVVPLLLPWIPFRSFYLKGGLAGVACSIAALALLETASMSERIALFLLLTSASSYTAMNFTGSTPFTSPSGVEREMQRGIPAQLTMIVISVVLWCLAPFWWGG